MSIIDKVKAFVNWFIRFVTIDMWNMDTNGLGNLKRVFLNILKAFVLTIRKVDFGAVNQRAAALTYRTLLAIVPLLAVLFAIARGFGFQNLVKSEIFNYFSGQKDVLEKAMGFIDKSLEYAKGGVFVGIGVVLLLYTVIGLFSNIEGNFNSVWKIKNERSYFRQFTDYLALILIVPIFIVCNAGLSIFINAVSEFHIIGLVLSPFIKLLPFLLTILLFTFIYIYIPNTKVKFSSGLFAGIVAGLAFQTFQGLYIGGQIWISKYNAIYGSFAALPLLLLWMQLSWFICLLGAELSFSYQNVKKFSFEKETADISQRYKDFITLAIMTLIVKRFEKGEEPFTADELSTSFKIPTQLTSDQIYLLLHVGLIIEVKGNKEYISAYVPAIDINKITVAEVFERIDRLGSEDFEIDKNIEFQEEWETILNIRKIVSKNFQTQLKDL